MNLFDTLYKLFIWFLHSQYYTYITDTRCKRVGTQCWVYGAIMVSEAILCIKNGKELFERTQAINIIVWLLIQAFVSVVFLYGCVVWHKYFQVNKKKTFYFSCLNKSSPLFIYHQDQEDNGREYDAIVKPITSTTTPGGLSFFPY